MFAADEEGYKYIVWVFNDCFAISSLEPCQLPSFFEKESLGTPAGCHIGAEKIVFPAKTVPLEHAVASRASGFAPIAIAPIDARNSPFQVSIGWKMESMGCPTTQKAENRLLGPTISSFLRVGIP